MVRYEYVNEVGKALAERIEKALGQPDIEAVVFIGALGICVRKILPTLESKYTDPAVVCVDSLGKWVIPVVGGHVGGANTLALQIARAIGAQPVITTQSDNSGLWALDTLAREYGWKTNVKFYDVGPHDDMNRVIADFVNRKPTALILEWNDRGTRYLRETCPDHVSVYDTHEEFIKSGINYEVTISVGPYLHDDIKLSYYPKCLYLGVGCQKDIPESIAHNLIESIRESGFAPESVISVNTIALKKDEQMISELCRQLGDVILNIYDAETLSEIEVPNPSRKVYDVTGCWGVAEASAITAGGKLVLQKHKGCVDGNHFTFALSAQKSKGHIEIVGAGPGDPELVSVRGRRFIQQADLILYAGSLVPKELTNVSKPGATVVSSADLDLEQQFELMKRFYDEDKLVVRLHTGDPCIYGAIQEQMAFFDQYSMDYHITPGISSFQAAAAELRSQFTIPEKCQTIILTRGEGRTPMPEKEKLEMLARHQSTLCIYLSAGLAKQIQEKLLEGGYLPETPVAVCYKLTWKEQKIFRGKLFELAKIVEDNNLKLTTLIVVGDAIDNRNGLSKLYDKHFTHLFRKGVE